VPRKDPGPSVKDKEQYEALRREGNSKEKSARIANASAASSRTKVARRGGTAGTYEDMSKDDLLARARRVGIRGRSKMNKSDLIKSLRTH
jgi:ribosome biogenesis GTPase A